MSESDLKEKSPSTVEEEALETRGNNNPNEVVSQKDLAKSGSNGVTDKPANDLEAPDVETCEGAFNKWGNPNCDGYYYKEDGSLWIADENGKESLVSPSYIRVIALSRTPESDEWTKRVEFKDSDNHNQIVNIRFSILLDNKEPLKILADKGLDFSTSSKKNILAYLQEAKSPKRIRQIKKPGWIKEHQYICQSFVAVHS